MPTLEFPESLQSLIWRKQQIEARLAQGPAEPLRSALVAELKRLEAGIPRPPEFFSERREG